MKRRKFLHTTGSMVTIPFLLNGLKLGAAPRSSFFNFINPDLDRVLVLVQLNGGNDGLNTVIPLDQYDGLSSVRENILIPENSVVKLEDHVGLHPAMKSMKWVYDQQKMNIIQSVGYPDQNRSHFRSTDIWTSGSPAEEFWDTGWLGRHLDGLYPGFPEGYPNDQYPDPFAITMGRVVSETCQGNAANFSMTLNDPFSLTQLTEGAGSEVPDTPYGRELDFLRTTIAQTNAYSEVITDAAEKGSNKAIYPEENGLANQLKNIALLLSGGLKTKVFICSIGGFDTHANQVDGNSVVAGEHSQLLNLISDAVAAFQQDLEMMGLDHKVIGMTFSEFGRKIVSNDSLGTDHGTAAPLIMFGSCVISGIVGDNPEIARDTHPREGVPMQHDFRDVYGSVLIDWFEISEEKVKTILYNDFNYIPLVDPCQTTTSVDILQKEFADSVNLRSFPNPFTNWTTISFNSRQEWAKLSVFDALGSEVKVLVNQKLNEGEHQVKWDASGFSAGTYFYRLQLEGGIYKTKRTVKVK